MDSLDIPPTASEATPHPNPQALESESTQTATAHTDLDVTAFHTFAESLSEQERLVVLDQVYLAQHFRLKDTPVALDFDSIKKVHARVYHRNKSTVEKKTKKNWTDEETSLLLWVTHITSLRTATDPLEFKTSAWAEVSELVPFKSADTCKLRWLCLKRNTLQGIPWTAEEDAELQQIIKRKGSSSNKWNDIAKELYASAASTSFRKGKQCRERWNNHLDPDMKRGDWTDEEDLQLLQLSMEHGSKWSFIAKQLKERTENAVKNRYKSLLRKSEKFKKRKAKRDGETEAESFQISTVNLQRIIIEIQAKLLEKKENVDKIGAEEDENDNSSGSSSCSNNNNMNKEIESIKVEETLVKVEELDLTPKEASLTRSVATKNFPSIAPCLLSSNNSDILFSDEKITASTSDSPNQVQSMMPAASTAAATTTKKTKAKQANKTAKRRTSNAATVVKIDAMLPSTAQSTPLGFVGSQQFDVEQTHHINTFSDMLLSSALSQASPLNSYDHNLLMSTATTGDSSVSSFARQQQLMATAALTAQSPCSLLIHSLNNLRIQNNQIVEPLEPIGQKKRRHSSFLQENSFIQSIEAIQKQRKLTESIFPTYHSENNAWYELNSPNILLKPWGQKSVIVLSKEQSQSSNSLSKADDKQTVTNATSTAPTPLAGAAAAALNTSDMIAEEDDEDQQQQSRNQLDSHQEINNNYDPMNDQPLKSFTNYLNSFQSYNSLRSFDEIGTPKDLTSSSNRRLFQLNSNSSLLQQQVQNSLKYSGPIKSAFRQCTNSTSPNQVPQKSVDLSILSEFSPLEEFDTLPKMPMQLSPLNSSGFIDSLQYKLPLPCSPTLQIAGYLQPNSKPSSPTS